MEEDGEKRVDWISDLHDSLLCQVLLNLPTKDVVKTSVLSTRWRNLWKHVPGLDLTNTDFSHYKTLGSFVDSFLDINSESFLETFRLNYNYDWHKPGSSFFKRLTNRFKQYFYSESDLERLRLKYDIDVDYEPEFAQIKRWIDTIVRRNVKHIDVLDNTIVRLNFEMPTTIYTCESLVFLKLYGVTLPSPNFVSLPSLKVMNLEVVTFADDLVLETLISHSPVLENLFILRRCGDPSEILRVISQSLLKFTYKAFVNDDLIGDFLVAIDAPRLEFLSLCDTRTSSFILNNPASLVKADIDTVFNLDSGKNFDPNDLPKRSMIRNFLGGISSVKDMDISSSTLEVFYDYSRCEQLPFFPNLSFLRVDFVGYSWEMLPIFLESCPNLKFLNVGSGTYLETERTNIPSGPRCLLPSLEYVEILRSFKGEAMEMELVSYLLENSTILNKLTIHLDDSQKNEESVIFKEINSMPRLSSSCKIIVF